MNKKAIITALLALVAMTGWAQEIKMNESSISDYLPLLKASGYTAYSFGLVPMRAIKDKWYELSLLKRRNEFERT